ncbi:hypothetical protein Tco_1017572 [Tanacetum coccineum]|uniref:Uncharacterized protein n=1 Tax=Tanacetum coccineum TaxID=301880 RepID=A0ABQ5FRV6_9ASTR
MFPWRISNDIISCTDRMYRDEKKYRSHGNKIKQRGIDFGVETVDVRSWRRSPRHFSRKDLIGFEERVDDVSLVDGVFDGTFGEEGEEDVVMGEGLEEDA